MDFKTFLSTSSTSEFWHRHKAYCFVGSSYPMLWFRMLFDMLLQKKLLPFPYQHISLEAIEKKSLHATLSQSILGNFSFFWFGNVNSEKESKALQETINFLTGYQGPHSIAFFTTQQPQISSPHIIIISLPSELLKNDIKGLTDFFSVVFDDKKANAFKNIITSAGSCDLDTSCMLLNYMELINSRYLDEYKNFLGNLVGNTPSLSLLSEYFFAKNSQAFFATWSALHTEYPDIFWIIFWAEQVWKGHHVIKYLKDKNFVAAKRIGSRLPYSFMNRDWQKSNTKELAQAYDFLYHMDYALKTGSTFCSLDLFYMNYLTGKFA